MVAQGTIPHISFLEIHLFPTVAIENSVVYYQQYNEIMYQHSAVAIKHKSLSVIFDVWSTSQTSRDSHCWCRCLALRRKLSKCIDTLPCMYLLQKNYCVRQIYGFWLLFGPSTRCIGDVTSDSQNVVNSLYYPWREGLTLKIIWLLMKRQTEEVSSESHFRANSNGWVRWSRSR